MVEENTRNGLAEAFCNSAIITVPIKAVRPVECIPTARRSGVSQLPLDIRVITRVLSGVSQARDRENYESDI
jgi:hypothetical protein